MAILQSGNFIYISCVLINILRRQYELLFLIKHKTVYLYTCDLLICCTNTFSYFIMFKVTADLTPVNAKKVAVKFDFFKIGGLVSILVPNPI